MIALYSKSTAARTSRHARPGDKGTSRRQGHVQETRDEGFEGCQVRSEKRREGKEGKKARQEANNHEEIPDTQNHKPFKRGK